MDWSVTPELKNVVPASVRWRKRNGHWQLPGTRSRAFAGNSRVNNSRQKPSSCWFPRQTRRILRCLNLQSAVVVSI